MGFSENLEGDLKNLESAAERDPAHASRRQASREAERAAALAVQPHAERLRNSRFTADLLNQASLLGRSRRLPLRISWLGVNLRLQAREHSLELRPTAEGVRAHFFQGQQEVHALPVDFSSSAETLAKRWLDTIDPDGSVPQN